jgi:hypothetical protein
LSALPPENRKFSIPRRSSNRKNIARRSFQENIVP